jgi:hypothetical protein
VHLVDRHVDAALELGGDVLAEVLRRPDHEHPALAEQ